MGFTVKATTNVGGGSVADLNKKNKSSISSLQKVFGVIFMKSHSTFFYQDFWQYQWLLNELGPQREKEHQEDC